LAILSLSSWQSSSELTKICLAVALAMDLPLQLGIG
jgi:hypothetical protein